jgi:hypothetical protein
MQSFVLINCEFGKAYSSQSGGNLLSITKIYRRIFSQITYRLSIHSHNSRYGILTRAANHFPKKRNNGIDQSLKFVLPVLVRFDISDQITLPIPAPLPSFIVNPNTILEFLNDTGWRQFAGYTGVTVLACVGYGSIFLAVGLLFRNPIIPTAFVLVWESANPFLPTVLNKTSLLYYLQSLCPVSAATTNPTLPPPYAS